MCIIFREKSTFNIVNNKMNKMKLKFIRVELTNAYELI